jgi:hypothetical protein
MAKQPQNRDQGNSGPMSAPQLQNDNSTQVAIPDGGQPQIQPIGRRVPPEQQGPGQKFLTNHPNFAAQHPNFQQNHPGMFNGNK